jgi:hypothetical protein
MAADWKIPIGVLVEFSLQCDPFGTDSWILTEYTIIWFHLDAPSSQAGARKPRGFDTRIGSRIKSQAKFQTAARRESSEDSMKRALLLIVVPALLIALGFAQTPAASINTDQTNIKGCLGGSDGNYTVVQDNTGQIFKITSSSVDLKAHLGQDVTVAGHKESGANSAADSFAATALNMISEHCAAAAAAPIAVVSMPSGTASTPPAAAAAPAATTSTVAETAITPAVATTPPAETVVVTPAATPAVAATPAAEIVVTPTVAATPPAETVVTPDATVSTPSETVIMPTETASAPVARHRRLSATRAAAAVATTPDVTASTPADTVVTPAAATPAATASTPAAADTTPTAPARSWTSWLLIPFVVLVLVLGTLVPLLSKWRKRKMLEARGAENLSFNREESSDKTKSNQTGPRKAA